MWRGIPRMTRTATRSWGGLCGMDARDILLYLDIYCEHDWEKTYDMIRRKDTGVFENQSEMLKIESMVYAILAKGYRIVTLIDADMYPADIRVTEKPPFVLYYKGDLETLADRYSYQSPSENPERMFIE
jgi:hypothetical protein